MAKAIWNDTIIAESEAFEVVEKNVYFPPGTVRDDYLLESATTTECSWKGTAHYYDVVVDGEVNADAAWYYPDPMEKAANIKDHIAFWKGVTVED
jgi:uncharacterized protein (DUF427 family)